jgi:PAS domain S-box-containing protein
MAREKSGSKTGVRRRRPTPAPPRSRRKSKRSAVDDSAARFRALTEHAFEAVALWDADGTVLDANPNSRQLLGYDPKAMVGQKGSEYWHPDDVPRFRGLLADLLRHPGQPATAEIRVRHADGSWRWVEGTASNLLDDPSVQAIVVNFRDVTERKRAESRLTVQYNVTAVLAASASLAEASPKLLQAICEGLEWDLAELWRADAGAGVLRLDGAWHVPSLDAAQVAVFSCPSTVLPGGGVPGRVWQTGEACWIPDLVADHMVRTSAAKQLGLHSGFAMPIRAGDQVTGVLLVVSRDIRASDDHVLHLLEALGRQISVFIERKRSEAQMFQLAAIVESSDDAILGVTLDGIITSWNAGAARMYGYAAAEMVDQPAARLLPPERADELANIFTRIRRGERIDHFETIRVRKDGTRMAVSLSISPIKDMAGQIIGASSIGRDITERERAAAQLREAQRLAQHRDRLADIGAITAEIVHELGNPLAGISAQAQLILRRANRASPALVETPLQPAQRILAEVDRLQFLIREFRDFARGQHLQLKAVELPRFLQAVVDLWQPVAASRGIVLTLEHPADVPPLTADEDKLRRALDNLVKNAIEAIDDRPGRVGIHVTLPEPDAVHISVIDTGPGVADSVRGFRLFETTKPYGTGLGLAIAQQIVRAHQGRIEFARLTPGGTVFRIELPRGGPLSA